MARYQEEARVLATGRRAVCAVAQREPCAGQVHGLPGGRRGYAGSRLRRLQGGGVRMPIVSGPLPAHVTGPVGGVVRPTRCCGVPCLRAERVSSERIGLADPCRPCRRLRTRTTRNAIREIFTCPVKMVRFTGPVKINCKLRQWKGMMTAQTEENTPHPGHGEFTVTVIAPRDPDQPRTFEFAREELVGDAARTAATAFGYTGGNPSFANDDKVVLDRNKTLAAEHVHSGDKLHLVDVGGGV